MRLLPALALTTLAASPPAAAEVVPLRWHERHTAYDHLAVTFDIDTLAVEGGRWSVALAIRNGDIALSVHDRFGIVVDGRRTLPATSARPRLPARLGPGEPWRGTISGRGRPPRGALLRLRLGLYRAVVAPNLVLSIVSRHAVRLR